VQDHGLQESIVDLIDGTDGRVGVCPETIGGSRVISIMARDIPLVDCPEIGEDLILDISLRVYDAWAPLFDGGEST